MKFTAAILGGGAGRRFGGNKLVQPLAGKPLITYALDIAAAAPAEDMLLLAGSPEVAEAGRQWATNRGLAAFRIVHVDTVGEGLGATLRAAALAVPPQCEGLYIFLGDMPLVPASIGGQLPEMIARGAPAAAPTCKGRRGHPVLLGARLIQSLHTLQGDRGAASLLKEAALVEINHDGVLFDVDTPEALLEAERRLVQQQRPLPLL